MCSLGIIASPLELQIGILSELRSRPFQKITVFQRTQPEPQWYPRAFLEMQFTFAYEPKVLRIIVATDQTCNSMIFYHQGILPASPAIIREVDYNGFVPDGMYRIPD